MALTVDQLLATLGVDASETLTVSGQHVIITRDPQPSETGVPSNSSIYMRVVDLGGDPAVPSTAAFNVYVDLGAGEVLAFDNTSILSPWNAAGSAVGQSSALSPYCYREVTLVQTPVFASEQLVTIRVDLTSGGGGWGHAPWGHFPWGHIPTLPTTYDTTYTFTAADTIAPNIVSAEAIGITTIQVTFDDGMATGAGGLVDDVAAWQPTSSTDTVGVTRLNVDPSPGVNLAITAIEAVEDTNNTQFLLTTNWEMTPGCLYSLTGRNTITDDAGNALDTATAQFTGFQPAIPSGRRFDYWQHMIPEKNKVEDSTQDLRRVANCIEELMALLLRDIDKFTDQFDPDLATDDQINLMLYDMGNPFTWVDDLTAIQRRKLLRVLVEIYKLKGTDQGIESVILFLLGEVVQVVEAMAGGWILGVDELGEGSIATITNFTGETYNFSSLPADLDLLIDSLPVTFTFVADDFQVASAATAREVVDALNGQRLVPATGSYIARPEGSLAGGAAYVDAGGTSAYGFTNTAEPWAISGGDTLEISVNGETTMVVFSDSDFATPGAALADEVALRVRTDIPTIVCQRASGLVVFDTKQTGFDAEIIMVSGTALSPFVIAPGTTWTGTDAKKISVYSSTAGADASIKAEEGTVTTLLGFSTTLESGTGGAILAPSESYTLYSFDIETQTSLSAETIAIIRRIVDYMKPAHTHLIDIRVAPSPQLPDGWVIGVDELDISTDLAAS